MTCDRGEKRISRRVFALPSLLCLTASVALRASVLGTPAPITYVNAAGNQSIYVFASGDNGHLGVNYWDGFTWNWADQGLAPGNVRVSDPAAITYVDAAGNRRIYVFASGDNGHLVVNYWDGLSWNWADQG